MSFPVAVQSAIFYIVACTPCAKTRHRQKARQKAKREREEKARVVAEQPHLYHHPDPFNTNPYWAEEIRMGPSLPKKGKGGDSSGKTASQRGLTNVSRDLASDGTGSSVAVGQAGTGAGANGSPNGSPSGSPKAPQTTPAHPPGNEHPGAFSSPTVVPEEDAVSATLSKTASVSTADWNLKRYQREDEELWGYEFSRTGQKLMDAIKQAGTTAGRFVESKLGIEKQVTEEDRYNFYFSPRNPPVNDYHPPVVSSKPIHRDALRWMLQPPPPAKVMEGKIPVSRTASMMSVGSRRTAGTSDGMSMGRRLGERALEAKLRNGETPYDEGGEQHSSSSLNKTRPRRTTATSTTRTRSRLTTRSHSPCTESGESSEDMDRRRSQRRSHRPAAALEFGSEDSEDEYISKSIESLSNGAPHQTAQVTQKLRLSTILSSEPTMKGSTRKIERSNPSSLPPLQQVTNGVSHLHETEKKGTKDGAVGTRVDSALALQVV